jgi:hypothetical protein
MLRTVDLAFAVSALYAHVIPVGVPLPARVSRCLCCSALCDLIPSYCIDHLSSRVEVRRSSFWLVVTELYCPLPSPSHLSILPYRFHFKITSSLRPTNTPPLPSLILSIPPAISAFRTTPLLLFLIGRVLQPGNLKRFYCCFLGVGCICYSF